MKSSVVCAFACLRVRSDNARVCGCVTTKYTFTNASWTDLGAGPLLLGFNGVGVFAVSDTTPLLGAEGFGIRAGRSSPLKTTSHVWGSSDWRVERGRLCGSNHRRRRRRRPVSTWSASYATATGMTMTNGG